MSKITPSENSDSVNSENVEVESQDQEKAKSRGQWGGQIEFILTLIGYAVGLGNIWRFPYLCFKNGGGAFLIPYFGTLALVGLPLFYMEVAFGQFASLGPTKIWTINPLFRGLGFATVMTNTLIGIYYNVIISWALYFLFSSMAAEVPWKTCDNSWNTNRCVQTADWKNISENYTLPGTNETIPKADVKSPSEEFYYRGVLQLSEGIEHAGAVSWQLALCLLLAWILIFGVLIRGISSLGKVVYFTTLFPYILLTVMLIRGVTLEGAQEGIIYYLKPNFSRLADARVWSDAATQIFFSLSVASGGLIAMSSYNKFDNNCKRDSILVPIVNCATSFYGGFAIFSVLGYMAVQKGVSVDQVAASGPGLVFVVYPEALATMPVAPLWSILFFLMMITLGLSSMFSIVETFFVACEDEFPDFVTRPRWRNILFRACSIVVFYLFGLSMVTEGGFYVFALIDNYLGGFPLLIIGLLEIETICHIYGWKRFSEDVEMMIGKKPDIYLRVCLCVISPIILLATTIFMAVQYGPPTLFSGAYVYPSWSEAIGFLVIFLALGSIPVWWIYWLLKQGLWKLIKVNCQPTENWKPALVENQTGRYARNDFPKTNPIINGLQNFENKQQLFSVSGIENETELTSNQGQTNQAFVSDEKVMDYKL